MYLFGASGHGKVVADILLNCNIKIKAFYDDNPVVESVLNIPIFSSKSMSKEYNELFIICIGNNFFRKKIVEKLNVRYTKAIHPSAVISKFSTINEGTVIMAKAIINPDTLIGKHCIINTASIIEHDCSIEDFVHISPNVSLAGEVSIGEGSHIGIGATVIQGIRIGKWATIGAGAVIIKDVPDYAVVVGNPGKIIKYHSL